MYCQWDRCREKRICSFNSYNKALSHVRDVGLKQIHNVLQYRIEMRVGTATQANQSLRRVRHTMWLYHLTQILSLLNF